MLYTITVVSPEKEDFAIELLIESDATFADLHTLIRESCKWEKSKPSTFYICDERWHRKKRIPEKSFEEDTMDEIELGDMLEDEGQRMQYIFDSDAGRGLLLEVSKIAFNKHIDNPLCRRMHGTAPALSEITSKEPTSILSSPDTAPSSSASSGIASLLAELNAAALEATDEVFEENDSDDEDLFDMEEIDPEGFDFKEE